MILIESDAADADAYTGVDGVDTAVDGVDNGVDDAVDGVDGGVDGTDADFILQRRPGGVDSSTRVYSTVGALGRG